MKIIKFFLILFSLNISTAYALPCPNGSGILYKGDSLATVISQCGQPNSQQTYTQVVNNLQEWIYYKRHAYDPGFSQAVILFSNDRVTNIQMNDRYWLPACRQEIVQSAPNTTTTQLNCGSGSVQTNFTTICGAGFGIGATTQTVAAICGAPNAQNNLQTESVSVTELYYTGRNAQTIVFVNGNLSEWK